MLRRHDIVLAVLLLSGVGASCEESQSRTRADWAISLKDSPVVLEAFSTWYRAKNTSPKRITGYQLACVRKKSGKLAIVHKLPFQEVSFDPGGFVENTVLDAPEVEVVSECVRRRKARVTVVEVRFADGTTWRPSKKAVLDLTEKGSR